MIKNLIIKIQKKPFNNFNQILSVRNMKAIQIKQNGGLEVLEHVDLPIPQLKNPEDILVKNKYIGVNYIDTYHRYILNIL